jgi:two-component system phosphate regulon response regulator PhoB
MTPIKDVKVLVVDDNSLVLDLLMKGLAPHCDARAAADGADALLRIVDEPPDLVVCDYRMPGLDGRQLYEKLRGRQQTKQIPFIFLASRSDIEEKLRPIVEGVEEFIPKPFFLKDVVRRAKKASESRRPSRCDSGTARGNEHPRPDAVPRNGPEILPPHDSPRRRNRRAFLFRRPVFGRQARLA